MEIESKYTDQEFRRFHYQRNWLRNNGYKDLLSDNTFKDCSSREEVNKLIIEQDFLYTKARNHARLTKAYEKAGMDTKPLKEKFKI